MTGRTVPRSWVVLPFLGACVPSSNTEPPAPARMVVDTVFVVDTVRVTVNDGVSAQARDENARLQMQVLERNAQIVELESRLDAAMQEAVRSMARVQTATSRAEAASSIAEAEIAIESLREQAAGMASPELDRARELLGLGTDAFESDNFGGAAYLATEARTEARAGVARFAQTGGGDEQLLLRPVPLVTTTRSNVRAGPGRTHAVQFTLDAGAELTGHAHSGQWIRVSDEENRTGWIFQSLVTGRTKN